MVPDVDCFYFSIGKNKSKYTVCWFNLCSSKNLLYQKTLMVDIFYSILFYSIGFDNEFILELPDTKDTFCATIKTASLTKSCFLFY